jgi:hypothetical protein
MTEVLSGAILVAAFVLVAVLAAILLVAAYKRAGARETSRDHRLS